MFKNYLFGFAAVLLLVSIGKATDVQAKLDRALGVNPVSQTEKLPQLAMVDCDAGGRVISKAGFSHVFATDCTGSQYKFNGFRGSNEYTIVFNANSNGYAVISR